jgi:hypothetical protein
VAELVGRRDECAALDRLVAEVLAGASWRVASAVGVESEMELAYSGLHQLCAPLLDHLGELPVPQRDALATVFGLSAGPAPDRFLVGLAALTLVAQAAEQQPLACIIDDAQWLDGASAQLLGFVARRLLAERVAVVGAARARIGDGALTGLPALPTGRDRLAYRPTAVSSCSPVRAGADGVMPSAASKRICWSGRGRSPFHTTAAVAVSG